MTIIVNYYIYRDGQKKCTRVRVKSINRTTLRTYDGGRNTCVRINTTNSLSVRNETRMPKED